MDVAPAIINLMACVMGRKQEVGYPGGRKDSEIVLVGRFTQLRSDKTHTWYLNTGDQLCGRM